MTRTNLSEIRKKMGELIEMDRIEKIIDPGDDDLDARLGALNDLHKWVHEEIRIMKNLYPKRNG